MQDNVAAVLVGATPDRAVRRSIAMADIKDVSTVIASALEEVSLSGKLDVHMDGHQKVVAIGDKGEQVEVKVQVELVEVHN